MPRWVCPSCQAAMNVKQSHIGQLAACVSCGEQSEVIDSNVFANIMFEPDSPPPLEIPEEHQAAPAKEYKVLSQKDKWFTGKFDPALLEQALNSYAQQGWILKAAVTASMPGIMSGNRDELIMILER